MGYSDHDRARPVAEPPKSEQRTDFERDRARVVHSSALRRLGAKTQVLGPASDDFVRTRLTHTLEVAQVGRELGKALGCDPDVVDTACLAHDLGHPPFGHNGERALAEVAAQIGGFEGNAQTLRLLTRLEPKVTGPDGRSVGLNLTRASLDASVKYPWPAGGAPDRASARKFGVYADDAAVFAWLRDGAPDGVRCLEAEVMDLADDVSYSVHDVEDAVVSGRLDLGVLADAGARAAVVEQVHTWYGTTTTAGELDAAMLRLPQTPVWVARFDGSRRSLAALKDMTSQLIGRFVDAAIAATRAAHGGGALTRYAARLVVPPATTAEILALKGLAATYVMAPRESEPLYRRQRELVTELVAVLVARAPVALEPPFAADWRAADDDGTRLRVVVDQVASLTDVSAAEWHARLLNPRARTMP
ncbi:deoxyguanosinetriphosphate triphosphohydrolase [Isoptericola sp. b441]|uniref:Deoxyguanosinetriphosphate triphosphohydrolase-like protein n=1 Tax=Actinotalea lenta TaxID=3064654 RepID=A0ABT9DEU8_9CELL|nr:MULTISPECIES: deoxyguanosinetriphosphate triphosphohydrolase [unclassified Isoptericola]MDO8108088.1 deoxyguanosinetriphosphate triphosphohydrolase [Isoptericola sp. b441]MDO8120243.1 deoxyguanosinetriphosphate triphosphohydrolase [Isoptericola sp. b490]